MRSSIPHDEQLARTLRCLRRNPLYLTNFDIADSAGCSESTITHLQRHLSSPSRGQREAAERLRDWILLRAKVMLEDSDQTNRKANLPPGENHTPKI